MQVPRYHLCSCWYWCFALSLLVMISAAAYFLPEITRYARTSLENIVRGKLPQGVGFGELNLQFVPRTKLTLRNVAFGEIKLADETLVSGSVEQIHADIHPLWLIVGKISIDELDIIGPQIQIDFPTDRSTETPAEPSGDAVSSPTRLKSLSTSLTSSRLAQNAEGLASLLSQNLRVDHFKIAQARILIQKMLAEGTIELNNLSASGSIHMAPGRLRLAEISVNTQIDGFKDYPASMFSLEGSLAADLQSMTPVVFAFDSKLRASLKDQQGVDLVSIPNLATTTKLRISQDATRREVARAASFTVNMDAILQNFAGIKAAQLNGMSVQGSIAPEDSINAILRIGVVQAKLDREDGSYGVSDAIISLNPSISPDGVGGGSFSLKFTGAIPKQSSILVDMIGGLDFSEKHFACLNCEGGVIFNDETLKAKALRLAFLMGDRKWQIDQAKISDARSQIEVSCDLLPDLGTASGKLKVITSDIQDLISKVDPKSKLPRINTKADLSFTGEVGTDGSLNASGMISASDLSVPSWGLNVKQVDLKQVNAKRQSGKSLQLTLTPSMSGLSASSDGGQFYECAESSGRLSASIPFSRGKTQVKGDLQVKDFAYRDSSVELTKVKAALSALELNVLADSSVEANVVLKGSDVALKEKSVTVTGVRSVSSPLKVAIPAKGGYSVSGPVEVTGGEMVLLEKDLRNVTGRVEILVSGPLKRFTSNSIRAQILSEPAQITKAGFEMTQTQYKVLPVQLNAFGGSISGSGFLGRNNGPVSLSAEIDSTEASKLLAWLPQEGLPSIEGRINHLSLTASNDRSNGMRSLKGQAKLDFEEGVFRRLQLDAALKSAIESVSEASKSLNKKNKAAKDSEQRAKEDTETKADNKKSEKTKSWQGTVARQLTGDFNVADNKISTTNVKMIGRFYTLQAKGSYDFDTGADVEASAVFGRQTLESMGGPFGIVGKLLSSVGRVEVPVKIRGKTTDTSVQVDPSRLLDIAFPTRIIRNVGKEVGKFFGKIQDAVTGESKSDSPQQSQPPLEGTAH